jgi:hypothetical protein
LNSAPFKPLLAYQRWESIRRPLYRLGASLAGFELEASVYPTGAKGYAVVVLLDGVHAPESPAVGFKTFEAAITAAKQCFSDWSQQLLTRV